MSNDSVHLIIKDMLNVLYCNHFDIFAGYLMFPKNKDKRMSFINLICEKLADNKNEEIAVLSKDAIQLQLIEYFNNKDYVNQFRAAVDEMLVSVLKITCEQDGELELAMRSGLIWNFVGIVAKKCIGSGCTDIINADDLVNVEPYIAQRIVSGFNGSVWDSRKSDEPILNAIAPKNYIYSKIRWKIKHLNKLKKRVKSIFILHRVRYEVGLLENEAIEVVEIFFNKARRILKRK